MTRSNTQRDKKKRQRSSLNSQKDVFWFWQTNWKTKHKKITKTNNRNNHQKTKESRNKFKPWKCQWSPRQRSRRKRSKDLKMNSKCIRKWTLNCRIDSAGSKSLNIPKKCSHKKIKLWKGRRRNFSKLLDFRKINRSRTGERKSPSTRKSTSKWWAKITCTYSRLKKLSQSLP